MSLGNWNRCREHRVGIMLHYDGSLSDKGALEWLLKDPRCKVSYNWIVTDEGEIVEVAPEDARAWHAGVCRPSDMRLNYKDANSAFYGIAIAAKAGEHATTAQVEAILSLTRKLYAKHAWPLSESWRVVSHRTEAWPRGRKIDPEGPKLSSPVLSTSAIRQTLQEESHAA